MYLAQAVDELHLLPGRFGLRPRSSAKLPFRQLEQFPPPEMSRRLLELSLSIPYVHARQSRVASPECRALCVADSVARGPAEAFIDGHEFCHLHPLPHGCLHLTLPAESIEGIVAQGWAERHPLHKLGVMETLVMVYAPRNPAEVDVVLSIVEYSSRFATGAIQSLMLPARSVA